jgi:hypothetical protein
MDKPEISDPAENETKQLQALRAQYLALVAKLRWVSEEKPSRRAFHALTQSPWALPDFGHRGSHPKVLFTVSPC